MLGQKRIVSYRQRGAQWALAVALFALVLAVFAVTSSQAKTSRTITAQRGDTVASIAASMGVSEQGIIRLNNLKRPYKIARGQRLRMPQAMLHVVRRGERLADVARRYRVSKKWLILLNGLRRPYRLRSGQRLFLPKSDRRAMLVSKGPAKRIDVRKPAIEQAKARARPVAKRARLKERARRKAIGNARLDKPRSVTRQRSNARLRRASASRRVTRSRRIRKPPALSGRGFAWPLRGRIVAGYGRRGRGLRNDGINIAARAGTTVRASENGVVIYSGSDVAGLGEVLLIKHAHGWVTAYAHNNRLLVRRGRVVRRGQAIARVGTTGAVLRPQLHFQIRKGAQPINPLIKLRRQRAQARR